MAIGKNLMKALFAVQQEIGVIGKDANNPFHKSKYATLEHVWEIVKPRLLKYNICVMQPALTTSDGAGCETIITHIESGEEMRSTLILPLPEKGLGAQGVGSCISYARRYSLTAALGLVVGDEDDDGEAAQGRAGGAGKSAGSPKNKGPAAAPAAPVSSREATQQKLAEAAKPVETAKAPSLPKEEEVSVPGPVAPVTKSPKERKLAVFEYLKSDGSFKDEDIRAATEKVLGRKVNPTGDVLLKSIVELEKLEVWVEKLKAMTGGKIGEWMRANPNLTDVAE
jgi:hypothetical protein